MEWASRGGQHPTIHYHEQPLDGNLNLFPWNSSIKRDPRRVGAPRVGCTMCTVLEKVSLLDLCVRRKGCKKMDKERKTMATLSLGLPSMTRPHWGPRWKGFYRVSSQTTQEDGNLSGPMAHSHQAFHQQIEA